MDDLDVDIGSDIDDHMDDAETLPFRYLKRAGVLHIWCNTSAVHEIRRTEGLKMTAEIITCSYCNKDYYDYYTSYIKIADRVMCIDCYHADVPAIRVGA